MRIDHINIKAPEDVLERVRDFYCTLLGLEEGFRPALASRGHWLYGDERPIVHLSVSGGASEGPTRGTLDHVAFQSSGLDALRARLDRNGVAYRYSYVPELELSQLFFEDPTGTGIEVNFPGERAT